MEEAYKQYMASNAPAVLTVSRAKGPAELLWKWGEGGRGLNSDSKCVCVCGGGGGAENISFSVTL